MNLLALETATDRCSVAVMSGEGTIALTDDRPRVHAKRILAMIEEALDTGAVALSDLDAIAYGRGPGSFTGLRIAAGVVQGLALGARLPVVPVSTLAAHAVAAERVHGAQRSVVCVDARMEECYWAAYRTDETGLPLAVIEDRLIRPDQRVLPDAAEWYGVGSGWTSWPALPEGGGMLAGSDPGLLPEAGDLLGMAIRALAQGNAVDAAAALPVYLRDSVAWQAAPRRS